jgi:hypothetical protein
MLPSKTIPTNSPFVFSTGLPELPPMMSFVETKSSGVSSLRADIFSSQRGERSHKTLPP